MTERRRELGSDAARERARRGPRGVCAVGAAALGLSLLVAGSASAQVIRDGSIGTAGPGSVPTVGVPGGTEYRIGVADGERSGDNLFHSFHSFDLPNAADRAVYEGPGSITNLITRVTGGQASTINGTIASEITGANLFFVNPAGVVFGESAQVDVTGAFHVSTADQILFADDSVLTVDATPTASLSIEDVAGFGFLDAPAPISVRGSQIELALDQRLTFVGGDLDILGGTPDAEGVIQPRADGEPGLVTARSGQIDLVSLASAGRVLIDADVDGDMMGDGAIVLQDVTERGNVRIAGNTTVSTSGIDNDPFRVLVEAPGEGSGPVNVYAKDLAIEDADIRTLTVTDEDAGDVLLDLEGELLIRSVTGGRQSGIIAGTGLEIRPGPGETVIGLLLQDPSAARPTYEAVAFNCLSGPCGVRYSADGAAGDVTVKAETVRLEDGGRITARSDTRGAAGTVRLEVSDEILMSGAEESGERAGLSATADSTGDPGSIVIDSPDASLVMSDQAAIVIQNSDDSLATSPPGTIEIEVRSLSMSGDARIDSSTRGAGPGGDLRVTASESISLTGRTSVDEFTGISTLSQPGSTGAAGSITVETNRLSLANGAAIAARPAVEGDVTGLGDAGSIVLDVGDEIRLSSGSEISTQSPNAAGGNVDAFFGRTLLLQDAEVSASVTSGAAPGGNVTLVSLPGSAAVLSDSAIIAEADAGAGGNILIETSLLFADPASRISASSRTGIDGTVVIRAPDGELIDLSQDLEAPSLDASALLNEPCAARRPSGANSLVVSQSDGVPIGVEAVLPAFLPADVYSALGEPEEPVAQADGLRLAVADGAIVTGTSGRCLN